MNNIHPSVILENCEIGDNITIEAFCVFKNTRIDNGVTIESGCRIQDSQIGENCHFYSQTRILESTFKSGCRIGCEVKKSHLGENNKAKHRSTIIGSTTSGSGVNFAGGCVMANYDGTGKGSFAIGDNTFLGANTVISVRAGEVRSIGNNCKIGAGCHVDMNI